MSVFFTSYIIIGISFTYYIFPEILVCVESLKEEETPTMLWVYQILLVLFTTFTWPQLGWLAYLEYKEKKDVL